MKKLWALVLCLCMMAMVVPAGAEGLSYLALGDSISTGFGLNDAAGEKGFVDILAENNGFSCVNAAVDGYTTANVLMQMADETIAAQIAGADVITLTCGGNDMLGLLYMKVVETFNAMMPSEEMHIGAEDLWKIMTDPQDERKTMLFGSLMVVLGGNAEAGIPAFTQSEEMDEALAAYLMALNMITGSIRRMNPDVTLIVATLYNPYKALDGVYSVMNTGLQVGAEKLSKAIAANAQAGGYLVADVFPVFEASAENLCNAVMEPLNMDIHPNAAGHAVFADCFQQVLDSLE